MSTSRPLAVTGILILSAMGAPLPAAAYSFSPPDTYAKLEGTLTLFPEGGTPFKCKVKMKAFTGKGTEIKQAPRIISASTTSHLGPCNSVEFESLPWLMDATGPNAGTFAGSGWLSGGPSCTGTRATFSDDANGVWKIPAGYCIEGKLTSSPPITIVP